MNDFDDPFESNLKSVTPASTSTDLRSRIENDLKPKSPLRWKLGVAAMMTATAAAIVLMISLNTGNTNIDAPDIANLKQPNKDSDAGINRITVLTFPVAKKDESVPKHGNWDPYLLRYLIPHADVILYGTVQKGGKDTEVKLTVNEVLRGNLKTLKIDATQERWRFGGCGPELAQWPLGKHCCVYLKYDKKKKTYQFIETGVPIQALPYQKMLDINHLREIIRVWDTEFAGKTEEQQQAIRSKLNVRKQLIFDIVRSSYKDHAADIKKLKAMGDQGKEAPAKKPFEVEVIDSGVKKQEE